MKRPKLELQGRSKLSRRRFFGSVASGAAETAILTLPGAMAAQPATGQAADGEMAPVVLSINGQTHSLSVEPRWTLQYVLRERLGLTGTKSGCDRGECGACTVLIDGIARYSCLTLALEAVGKQVTTVEGLLHGEQLGPVQQAFVEEAAFQCGYCTPGQVVAVEALLRKTPQPTMEQIREGVSGNLCRCAAYNHIFRAAQRAAELRKAGRRAMAEETVKPWDETKIIGKPIPPVDGYERVSGTAVYPLDVILPNMLYGAILRCPHAHATVRKIDVGKARRMPGVRAVLTDADPEAQIAWYAPMRFPGAPVAAGGPQASRLFDPHCRYEGEEVAAVAAESPQQAWDAVRAIQVEYETQPFVIDMEEALKPGAPPVQEGGNRGRGFPGTKRGDVGNGFAEADVVLEETYRTSCLIHVPMEVHGSVAQWDGDCLTVWDTNQGPFGIQSDIARDLKMPLSKVRVISNYMGGGFGSKQEAGKYTIIAALLAQKTARPVKLFLTREETFLCVGNRPAHIMKLKAGVKKDGTLTALQLTAVNELGAYPTFAGVGGQVGELYTCPNVLIDETQAYINAGQQRAFRAPGYPECNWALEQMMDALAEKIGMDPVELRLKNIPSVCQTNQDRPYTSTGLRECLTEGAQAFGWKEGRSRPKGDGAWVRGVGVASGLWGPGSGPATVIVKLNPDGSVNLNMGAADLGTGTKTVAASIVAEELGVPLDRIRIENADTGTTPYSGVSGGSKTVSADGPPTRLAALEVKRFLLEMAAEQLKVPVSDLAFQDGAIMARGGAQKLAITELTQLRQQQGIVGVGRGRFVPGNKVIRSFATHFAEVEVNRHTGEMRVLRMLAAHDSGRVMNLLGYRNQVFGGFLQGLGLAMTERRVLDSDSGKMVNANFHDYKIPTAKDVPGEMTCLPIDPHDTECNTLGAKGLGEPATVPAATAIANALYHATGVRVKAAPITAAQVLTLLAEPKTRG